jgi:hypothetical protein
VSAFREAGFTSPMIDEPAERSPASAAHGLAQLAGLRSQKPENGCCDAGSGLSGVLVLPNADHLPASPVKVCVGVGISTPVGCELGFPPLGVSLRPCRVIRAHVPEAPVYEDGQAETWKHDVGPPTLLGWKRRPIDEEPKAAAV